MAGKKEKEPEIVTITIQEYKKKIIIAEREKEIKDGIIERRCHVRKEKSTSEEVAFDKWITTEYRIPLRTLGLREDAPKKEILEKLNDPSLVVNKHAQELLKKLVKSYDGIKSTHRGRLDYKTERFRKRKDYTPKKKVIM